MGSHWLLEPSWSSAFQSYDLDGGEAGRLDKVRSIFQWRPDALRRLRVCFEARGLDSNCGVCEKCLRTLLAMRLCGGEEYADSFAKPLDIEKVKNVHMQPFLRIFWLELLEEARSRGDTAAARAVEIALGERFDWSRLGRRIGLRRLRRVY